MYQTHNNNNYPKHNTIAININKVNEINTVLTAPPQISTPPQELLLKMAKGSLLMMCGDAIKLC